MAGISGSKHDFADSTKYPTNWSNGQICLPCHAPHNATPRLIASTAAPDSEP